MDNSPSDTTAPESAAPTAPESAVPTPAAPTPRPLHVDARLTPAPTPPDAPDTASHAHDLERRGYTTLWVRESAHDPFLALALAAGATTRARLGTGVAIALARSPMTVAYQANDLALLTRGRFVLGLGSQVRAHVERRFGMPGDRPAARMAEFVRALRAIWHSWQTGDPLAFDGAFYRHTLMPPSFSPGPNPYGPPPVFLAAVGPTMTATAGELADGLMVHAFTTPDYLRATTLPTLARGLARSGRSRADVEVHAPVFVVSGRTEEEIARARAGVRRQLAFYASTPAYRPVLAHHGWSALGEELHAASRGADQSRWQSLSDRITDDVLHTFAAVGTPAEVAAQIVHRYAGIVDRVSLYTVDGPGPETLDAIAAEIRAQPAN